MSTIHRPAPIHLWWYAAAAVLTCAVLTLVVLTLQSAGSDISKSSHDPSGRTDSAPVRTYKVTPYTCFAGRPVVSADLESCALRPDQ